MAVVLKWGSSRAFQRSVKPSLKLSLSPHSFLLLSNLTANVKMWLLICMFIFSPSSTSFNVGFLHSMPAMQKSWSHMRQRLSVWPTFSCKSKSFVNMTCVSIKISPQKGDIEYVWVTLAERANCLTLWLHHLCKPKRGLWHTHGREPLFHGINCGTVTGVTLSCGLKGWIAGSNVVLRIFGRI